MSAIGRIQLQRLLEWTAARIRNALLLAEALAEGWSRDRILSEIYLERCFQEAGLAPA